MSIDAGGFNPWGSWEDFSATLNRQGYAWKSLIGQDEQWASWTPSIAFGGGTTGILYSSQTGRYIKYGRMVYAFFAVVLTNKGSSTGAATLNGLPASQASGGPSGTWALLYDNMTTNWANIMLVTGSDRQMTINGAGAVGVRNNTALQETDFSNSTRLNGAFFYFI